MNEGKVSFFKSRRDEGFFIDVDDQKVFCFFRDFRKWLMVNDEPIFFEGELVCRDPIHGEAILFTEIIMENYLRKSVSWSFKKPEPEPEPEKIPDPDRPPVNIPAHIIPGWVK